jgi:hypothetical protein
MTHPKINALNSTSFTVEPGVYYIGDPCYAFSHTSGSWEILGENSGWFQDSPIAELKGNHVLGLPTKYGDGSFTCSGQVNGEFIMKDLSVDAGLLGLIPVELAERSEEELEDLYLKVTFREQITVEANDGILVIDSLQIDHGLEDEDEYEDEYYED